MEQVAGNVSSNVEEGLDVVPAGQELPDKAETSLMLALDAQQVRSELSVREFPPDTGQLTPEGRLRYAWLAHDISASGVMGDATRGNAAEGEAVLDSLVDGWVDAIRAIHEIMPRLDEHHRRK